MESKDTTAPSTTAKKQNKRVDSPHEPNPRNKSWNLPSEGEWNIEHGK